MKIYTKGGDKGQTSLIYGSRVSKNDARVEAYGTCDEANSMIGLALSHLPDRTYSDALLKTFREIQTALFHVGAELATPKGKEVRWTVGAEDVARLEQVIDQLDGELAPLKNFVLPGGHPTGATLHVARTIVRRAERHAVSLGEEVDNVFVLQYLNRLSDFLFVAARWTNQKLQRMEPTLHE
ncbi:cob(I)yrinic acid a,c-diamide adenosyltransferase [Bacillus fonticola]|uniref:cob(I)yrinic acid a,c-diamide adenosyltransferase n=1 Tax=Bacillus fonticola TaxID=2728853 RepID=UPI0014742DA1|nr:cob(I)yrinic acid a,c-diamide adenosyltransferase [Bacillus fonticola]